MVWGFFRKKEAWIHERFESLHRHLGVSFSAIKKDMTEINRWLYAFQEQHKNHKKGYTEIERRVREIEAILPSLLRDLEAMQTVVQTAVQNKQSYKQQQTNSRLGQTQDEPFMSQLRGLSITERAIVWVLLNTDLKYSYEDLKSALGKDESTLRGQINQIKKRCPHLIHEYAENSGKKRFFIDEKIKSELFKTNQQRPPKRGKSEG